MAFGFPPCHAETIELVGDRRTAREAVVETFAVLGWEFVEDDPYLFRALTRIYWGEWGEIVTISLEEPGIAVIRSEGRFRIPLFDWGKNKRNVREFAERFVVKEVRNARLADALGEQRFLVDSGQTPVGRLFVPETDG